MLNAAVDRNDPRHGSEGGLPAEEAAALLKVASDAAREWSDPEVLAATAEQQGFGEGAPTLGTDPCFEALIDHPGWISHIRDFIGGADAAAFLSMGCIIRAPLPAPPPPRPSASPDSLRSWLLTCAARCAGRLAGTGVPNPLGRPQAQHPDAVRLPRRRLSLRHVQRHARIVGLSGRWGWDYAGPRLCAPSEAPCALAGGRPLTRVACGLAAQELC